MELAHKYLTTNNLWEFVAMLEAIFIENPPYFLYNGQWYHNRWGGRWPLQGYCELLYEITRWKFIEYE